MTEYEKFIFKSLQWFIALGVTLLLFGLGYFISFAVSEHNRNDKQDIAIEHVREAHYQDSIRININTRDISIIKAIITRKGNNVLNYPNLEAALRDEDKYYILKPSKK